MSRRPMSRYSLIPSTRKVKGQHWPYSYGLVDCLVDCFSVSKAVYIITASCYRMFLLLLLMSEKFFSFPVPYGFTNSKNFGHIVPISSEIALKSGNHIKMIYLKF